MGLSRAPQQSLGRRIHEMCNSSTFLYVRWHEVFHKIEKNPLFLKASYRTKDGDGAGPWFLGYLCICLVVKPRISQYKRV